MKPRIPAFGKPAPPTTVPKSFTPLTLLVTGLVALEGLSWNSLNVQDAWLWATAPSDASRIMQRKVRQQRHEETEGDMSVHLLQSEQRLRGDILDAEMMPKSARLLTLVAVTAKRAVEVRGFDMSGVHRALFISCS